MPPTLRVRPEYSPGWWEGLRAPLCYQSFSEASLRCSGCKSAWYSSHKAQESHWPSHAHFCKPPELTRIAKLSLRETVSELYGDAHQLTLSHNTGALLWHAAGLLREGGQASAAFIRAIVCNWRLPLGPLDSKVVQDRKLYIERLRSIPGVPQFIMLFDTSRNGLRQLRREYPKGIPVEAKPVERMDIDRACARAFGPSLTVVDGFSSDDAGAIEVVLLLVSTCVLVATVSGTEPVTLWCDEPYVSQVIRRAVSLAKDPLFFQTRRRVSVWLLDFIASIPTHPSEATRGAGVGISYLSEPNAALVRFIVTLANESQASAILLLKALKEGVNTGSSSISNKTKLEMVVELAGHYLSEERAWESPPLDHAALARGRNRVVISAAAPFRPAPPLPAGGADPFLEAAVFDPKKTKPFTECVVKLIVSLIQSLDEAGFGSGSGSDPLVVCLRIFEYLLESRSEPLVRWDYRRTANTLYEDTVILERLRDRIVSSGSCAQRVIEECLKDTRRMQGGGSAPDSVAKLAGITTPFNLFVANTVYDCSLANMDNSMQPGTSFSTLISLGTVVEKARRWQAVRSVFADAPSKQDLAGGVPVVD
eukprot:TRINITY_DN29918_c0_g1_i1.p1 TRINITY_DN29918_c0_g1~~TRINITY_DN29918_c0_g1_i1.p1  ORF type:complete len:593 (+),score=115.34 TRINITY_DN29918_c0_g1_i1:367-2145(+)